MSENLNGRLPVTFTYNFRSYTVFISLGCLVSSRTRSRRQTWPCEVSKIRFESCHTLGALWGLGKVTHDVRRQTWSSKDSLERLLLAAVSQ